jgi:hypothetical protein
MNYKLMFLLKVVEEEFKLMRTTYDNILYYFITFSDSELHLKETYVQCGAIL